MFHYTRALGKAGFKIIFSYFSFMRPYSKKPNKYPLEKRFKKVSNLCKKASDALQADLHVEGLENIPNETCCFFSNHLSTYDALAFLIALDKPFTFIAKKESEKYPFIGKCIKSIDGDFIDRADLKQSLRVMMKMESDLKKGTKNWLIFPEGTRNKDQMMLLGEFHHGTFRPAMKAKVPLVPAVICGSALVFKTKPQFKKYPVYLKFLKPIMPSEYEGKTTQEVAILVQNRIQQALTYEARSYIHKEFLKLKSKKYRFNEIY